MKKLFIMMTSILFMLPTFASANNVSDKQATDLIIKFYHNYVLSQQNILDVKTAKSYGTPAFLKKLENAYDYDCDDVCYGIWELRTGYQDGPSEVSKVTKIIRKTNGWYQVNFIDMGHKGSKQVKITSVKGQAKFTDYK